MSTLEHLEIKAAIQQAHTGVAAALTREECAMPPSQRIGQEPTREPILTMCDGKDRSIPRKEFCRFPARPRML
jgi:hypothetical protein